MNPLRAHFANFDYGLRGLVKKSTFFFSSSSPFEDRLRFIFINYNSDFVRKAEQLIEGLSSFADLERLTIPDKTHLTAYINQNKEFISQAESLMRNFQSADKLTESEQKTLRLYVNHNLAFRNKMNDWFKKPRMYDVLNDKNSFDCAFQFDRHFRVKVQALAKGNQPVDELLPEEQHLLTWYVNCSEEFASRVKKLL